MQRGINFEKALWFFFLSKIFFPCCGCGQYFHTSSIWKHVQSGDEIFLCNKYGQNTEGKQFLFYGFVRNKADVKYCQCIVHEPLTRVTRTAPLVYVAHIPNGKFARQTLEQISEADTEVYAWMQEVRLFGHLVFLGQWIDCQKPETPLILQAQIFRWWIYKHSIHNIQNSATNTSICTPAWE